MIWDTVSPLYDAFETLFNHRVYSNTGKAVAEEIEADDVVLECACGTGAISQHIAPKCRLLIATDLSEGMLRQAYEKCSGFGNVKIRREIAIATKECMMHEGINGFLVSHGSSTVPPEYVERINELGGQLENTNPTYIRDGRTIQKTAFAMLEKIGVHFNREFDLQSYKHFFLDAGYPETEFRVVEGLMPCAIAIITKT